MWSAGRWDALPVLDQNERQHHLCDCWLSQLALIRILLDFPLEVRVRVSYYQNAPDIIGNKLTSRNLLHFRRSSCCAFHWSRCSGLTLLGMIAVEWHNYQNIDEDCVNEQVLRCLVLYYIVHERHAKEMLSTPQTETSIGQLA